jgi:DNA transposition AAA+ family ATPase
MTGTQAPAAPGSQFAFGHHIKELAAVDGYQAVRWDPTTEIEVLMKEASRANSIMTITGNPGVGKSFAAGRAAEACAVDRRHPTEVVWIELSHSARGKTLLAELCEGITGLKPMPTATLASMRNELAQELTERHRLLVLDEAQHVSHEAMRALRWLLDRPETDTALVIVGLPKILTTMAPEMRSRVSYELRLDVISDDEIVGVLRAYHPIFETADGELLRTLNRVWARGRFRWWAHFLARAVRYSGAPGFGGFDQGFAEFVAHHMPKGA